MGNGLEQWRERHERDHANQAVPHEGDRPHASAQVGTLRETVVTHLSPLAVVSGARARYAARPLGIETVKRPAPSVRVLRMIDQPCFPRRSIITEARTRHCSYPSETRSAPAARCARTRSVSVRRWDEELNDALADPAPATTQVAVPLQAPVQPLKVAPANGVAVSVTARWNIAVQLPGQSIPPGCS